MPMPASIVTSTDTFRLDEKFAIAITAPASSRLNAAASRTLKRLSERTGLLFLQDFLTANFTLPSGNLLIECRRTGNLKLNEDESYTLKVTTQAITLTAETDIGALYGLETLLQLLSSDHEGYFFPGVAIEDKPRFPWRGLLIDVGRHFMPVEVMKRNFDGMAAVKLNVLHWHLSDYQGFRVESKTYPKLHQMGSDGYYYTQEQLKEMIAYAEARGIRVVPEFDIPGHSTSWLVGYPEIASAPGPFTIARRLGVLDPTLDPTNEKTYEFLDAFFAEMAALFPDEYFHIGGDEVNGAQWNRSPAIQAFMKANHFADNNALQSYFNKRVLALLTKHGKKMMGWDEILQPDLPKSIVCEAWREPKYLVQAAQQGYQVILANGYYIDLAQSTDFHYLNDPIPADSPLSELERQNVLGGEATMWGEFISPETIDSRIWPRTAAIAERFWSPGRIKDVDDMYRRLDTISLQLEEFGLTHEKNFEMILRRLAKSYNIEPLKSLVEVVEPVEYFDRMAFHEYTALTPLSRVADAASPDARVARNFRQLVDRYLDDGRRDPALATEIEHRLTLWSGNHAVLLNLIKPTPVLAEIEELSKDFSTIAGMGLSAMDFFVNRRNLPRGWAKEKFKVLEKAQQPRAAVELKIVSPIQKLVLAAQPIVALPAFTPNGGISVNAPMTVTITTQTPDAQIRYTLDGSEPTQSSTLYRGPLTLDKTTPLKAVALKKGMEESFVAGAAFSVVDSSLNGLRCAYYEGEWQALPDFVPLSRKGSSYAYEFSLDGISTRHQNYALEFSGFIKISRDGPYTFYTNSDDGSRVVIGDTEVVMNDSLHAPLEKEGRITLQAGFHPIKVSFFQAGGGEYLRVSYAGPGIDKQPIPAGVLFRAKPVSPTE